MSSHPIPVLFNFPKVAISEAHDSDSISSDPIFFETISLAKNDAELGESVCARSRMDNLSGTRDDDSDAICGSGPSKLNLAGTERDSVGEY